MKSQIPNPKSQTCLVMEILISFCLAASAAQLPEVEEREQAIREALFVASSAQGPKVLKIGMVDCITYTLKNNSEIKIIKIEPLIAKQDKRIAEAGFDPSLSFEGSVEDSKSESATVLAGSHSRTEKFDFGLGGKLPLGTEYDLDFLNKKYKDNSTYLSVNPYYKTEFVLTVTQPLFRDFGSLVNRADIAIANNNWTKSNQNVKNELMDVISQVKEAYHKYVLEIEKYKTQEISLARARGLLEIIQKKYEHGLASSIDLLEAKTGVAEREGNLLQAAKNMDFAEDNLKYLTNLINDVELWSAHIEPLDRPEFEKVSVDLVESLKQAFTSRPDYEAAKIELNNQNIRLAVKENAALPTIDLVGSFGLNGLDQDYPQALKADYKKWSTAVKVSWPWGNQEAEADYEKSSLTKEQLLVSFERLQQKIILEVRDAVRGVNTAEQAVTTATERLDTEKARYAAIELRFGEGLVSTHEMLEYQEDLSNAQTAYLQALMDYSASLINLEKITGVTLVKNNITMEE